jgi:acyl-CoA reductase-like NAD-dependent aldehyde dehydrogenase
MKTRLDEINEIFLTAFKLMPSNTLEYWIQKKYLINGELREWHGESISVLSPLCYPDGKRIVFGSYPNQTEKESQEALLAAMKAYDNGMGEWPKMGLVNRIQHLEEFVKRMKLVKHIVVELLILEIAKDQADAEKEFDRTVEYIEETIKAAKKIDHDDSTFILEEGIIAQIRRSSLGVVLCMGPFNYPLNETFTTLIPALLMGNTIIFKPPRYGVLLHSPLLEAFRDCFPKGVINTIYGDGKVIINPIMVTGKVNVLAFIGTSKVANILKHQHPHPNRLKCVLGLDAKNPAIVLDDADLELTVKECILGALSYNGQRCTAIKIIFIKKGNFYLNNFIQMMSEEIEKLKIGLPMNKEFENLRIGTPMSKVSQITPLVEENKTDFLKSLIDDAVEQGAKVINPSGGISNGTFFYPAIVYPAHSDMRLYKEEQFGPIIPIVPFDFIEEPIEYIIKSNFGQQVSIFGKDNLIISHLIDSLFNQVSRININCQCQRGPDSFPFTGRKDSAEGTLSIIDALKVFSIRSVIAAKENETNKNIIKRIVYDRTSKNLSRDFIF